MTQTVNIYGPKTMKGAYKLHKYKQASKQASKPASQQAKQANKETNKDVRTFNSHWHRASVTSYDN